MSIVTTATSVGTIAGMAGALLLAAPATAAPDPRLRGNLSVVERVVRHASMPGNEGRLTTRQWRFRTRCAEGRCATRVRFRAPDGVIVHRLERVAKFRYQGTTTYLGNCYDKKTGNLRQANAYVVRSRLTLVVQMIAPDGTVNLFRTVRKLRHQRRAGASRRCDPVDYIKLVGELDDDD